MLYLGCNAKFAMSGRDYVWRYLIVDGDAHTLVKNGFAGIPASETYLSGSVDPDRGDLTKLGPPAENLLMDAFKALAAQGYTSICMMPHRAAGNLGRLAEASGLTVPYVEIDESWFSDPLPSPYEGAAGQEIAMLRKARGN